jgi:hypothetical protein
VSETGSRTDAPTSKIGALRLALLRLMDEHRRDGAIPTNARFLFYELIARGIISKEKTGARRPDQDLHEALTQLREAGDVPWEDIEDETREIENYTGFRSIKGGLLAQVAHIRLDPWQGRPPFILTESRSLAGALRPVVSEYRCLIASTNGQCGGFLHTNIAPALSPDATVLYFGDYDIAGDDIEGNTRRVLEGEVGGDLDWARRAITRQQIIDHDLTVIIKTDKRHRNHRFERELTTGLPLQPGEHEAVETEALRQTVITDIPRFCRWEWQMTGGRASREKGNRAERAIVRLLQERGFGAERVPLSGAARGRFGGDVSVPLLGRDLRIEVKCRADGFRELYKWLADADVLIIKADRLEPLAITRLKFAATVASAAERKKFPQ